MTQTELLKAALKERGVTQRAVAERLHTTEQALSKTLSRPTLTTTKLAAIIDAVNASVIAVPDHWHDGDKVTVRISKKTNENEKEK